MKFGISILPILTLLFGWEINQIFGAKILALLPVASPSHHIMNRALYIALITRGHQLTVITPDAEKQKLPNLTEYLIEGVYEKIHESEFDYADMSSLNHLENSITWFEWGEMVCGHSLDSKAVDKLLELKDKERFDLVIIDMTFQECFLALVPLFNSPPVIAITAYISPPWFNMIVGNPQILSYTSTYVLPYSDHMTFLQRMENFLIHNYVMFYYNFVYLPAMDSIVRARFGDSIAVPSETIKNISMVMVNTHISIDYPRPIVPAMVEIGGLQTRPGQELPKDLKKFLDEAEHGAIFFSLGTNIMSNKLKEEKVKAFLEAFAELPQRVLWKWESDVLPNQPKNVMARKWLPQNDILAHPNVKLFISHCGLLSAREAIYHGVPVVGMPFIADQFYNIFKFSTRGLGEALLYQSATKENTLKVVRKVINDPSYKENMKKASIIFRDQPETPLERAVFWTEYVIRHKGAAHLKARSADLPLHQYLLLDVIATLIATVVLILCLFYLVLRTICRSVFPSRKNNKSKQQ